MSMGGGGSQPQTQSETRTSQQTPWAPASPYLEQIMRDAAKNYAQGPQQYTPFSQVQGFMPTQLAAQQGLQNYLTSPNTQQFMRNLQTTVSGQLQNQLNPFASNQQLAQSQLMGFLGSQQPLGNQQVLNQMVYGDNTNPYLQSQITSQLENLSNQFVSSTLPALRRQAVGDFTYGSSRNALLEGQAMADVQRQMQEAATGLTMNDKLNQEALRAQALGQMTNQQLAQANAANQLLSNASNAYLSNIGQGLSALPSVTQLPLSTINQLYQVGADQQAQQQRQLQEATNRWNYQQNQGWEALNQYAQLINPLASYGGTRSSSSMTTLPTAPSVSTAGNIAGGLLSMAPQIIGAFGGLGSTGPTGGGTVDGINLQNRSLLNAGSSITPLFR